MKNTSLKTKGKFLGVKTLLLSGLLALTFSCSDDQTELLDEEAVLDETSITKQVVDTYSQKTTPVVGGIYAIANLRSGRTLDVDGASNSNNANIHLWGTNTSSPPTHRQWEVISTDNGYIRLRCVDSQKTLEKKGSADANGTNVSQWAYADKDWQEWEIVSLGSNLFGLKNRDSGTFLTAYGANNGSNVVVHNWVGASTQKWYFYQVGGSNSGGGSSGGNTPGAVLGINDNTWKLNGFTATPSASATYYDNVADQVNENISTWSNDNYFYTDGEWAFFRCYRGLGTSQNSNNPRVELREMSGGNEYYWTNEGTNEMQFTVRVDQLSNDVNNSNGVTCVGQIHGPGSTVDDIIRVQFYGDAGQTSGAVRIKISGYITEDVMGGSQFLSGTYYLDTAYTMKITYNSDDYVRLYINGSQVFSQQMDRDDDDNYFKVGNYLQQSSGASFDGSSAIVRIKDLSVTHTN